MGILKKNEEQKKTAHNMDLASLLRGGKSGVFVLNLNIGVLFSICAKLSIYTLIFPPSPNPKAFNV
jgi:hypothetical protein